MAKKKVVKKLVKKSKYPKAEAKEKGVVVGHEDIVLAIRACGDSPKDLLNLCVKKWGVAIPPSMLGNVPNSGILRMRVANIVRGALTRVKRFRGEVYRVPRKK